MGARYLALVEGFVTNFPCEFSGGVELVSFAAVDGNELPFIVDCVDGVGDAVDEGLQSVAAFE